MLSSAADNAGVASAASGKTESYLVAATALGLMLAGTLLPLPLFQLYHRVWGLSPAQISVVFAVYVSSLIPALLFLGGLSDSMGRRRAMLIALGILAIGSVVFACAQGFAWLIVARIVQGVGMGIGSGAAAAAIREWMPENQRHRAGLATVVAIGAGSALGALVGGIVAEYAPLPLVLPYVVHVILLGFGAIAVAAIPAPATIAPVKRPVVLRVPRSIRRAFSVAAAVSFTGWTTFAIFSALVPTYLARTLDLHSLLVGTSVVVLLQAGMLSATPATGRLGSRTAIVTAMCAIAVAIWTLLLGTALHAVALVVVASFIAGAGGGLGYLVALNIVNEIAPPDQRAGTLSALLLISYIGYSVPALALGIAATRYGLDTAFIGAAAVLCAMSFAACLFATPGNLRIAATAP